MTSFALRVPDYIMDQVKDAAADENTSINQLLVSFIAEGIGHRRGLKLMHDRAERADMDKVLAILSKVPDVPPVQGDEIIDTNAPVKFSM